MLFSILKNKHLIYNLLGHGEIESRESIFMISVSKIRITINGSLIVTGEISLHRGSVTAINGKSGSGKSSLLYLLSLFSSHGECEYLCDEETVNIQDEDECARMRRKYSFLFQDNSLLDNLTVEENLKQAGLVAGINSNSADILELLNRVDLTEECLSKYPRQLSGGEQQRVALACSLVRKPEYLFVDEPTASLDDNSTQIVLRVLKEEAEKGTGICIASHDSRVWGISDHRYEILDCKIIPKTGFDLAEKPYEKECRNESLFSTFKYACLQRKKEKSVRRLVTIICALAVVAFALVGGVLKYLEETHRTLINQVSDKEIFTVNLLGTREEIYDADGNPGITKDEFAIIKQITGVEKVYSYFEFDDSSIDGMTYSPIQPIIVRMDGSEKEVIPFCSAIDLPAYSVVPYYQEQQIESHVSKWLDSGTDCYISAALARALGAEECKNELALVAHVWVPIRKELMNEYCEDVAAIGEYDICSEEVLEINVRGIIDTDFMNRYSMASDNLIYMPYETMNFILNNRQTEVQDQSFQTSFAGGETKEWNPSAAVVYVDSQRHLKFVSSKIENINGGFLTKCDYSNAEKLEKIISVTRSVSKWVTVIVVLILFFLMFALFMSYTLSRKREFALLKVYGIDRIRLIRVTIADGLLYAMSIVIMAIVLCAVVWLVGNLFLVQGAFNLNTGFVLLIPVMTLGFIIIPMVISALYAARLKADNVMRF